MSIKYSLNLYPLITDKSVYKALVHPAQVVSDKELYDKMAEHGSTLTKADIIACMQLYKQTLLQYLDEGYSINTPWGNYRLSIKGKFDTLSDIFSKDKHQVRVNISPSREILKRVQKIRLEKVPQSFVTPNPQSLFDNKSAKVNSTLTAGNLAKLVGNRLQFDVNNLKEGIFFINKEGEETRAMDVMDVGNKIINFLVPSSLKAGEYQLLVRRAYTQNNEIRTGYLTSLLEIL